MVDKQRHRRLVKKFENGLPASYTELDLVHFWYALPPARRKWLLEQRWDDMFRRLSFREKCLLLEQVAWDIKNIETELLEHTNQLEESKWLQQSKQLLAEVRKYLQGGEPRRASKLHPPESSQAETSQHS